MRNYSLIHVDAPRLLNLCVHFGREEGGMRLQDEAHDVEVVLLNYVFHLFIAHRKGASAGDE